MIKQRANILVTRIQVAIKPGFYDAEGEHIRQAAQDLGIETITAVRHFRVFYIAGELSLDEKEHIAKGLLADAVTDEFSIDQLPAVTDKQVWSVEITFNRGVTDMVAGTTLKAIWDLGIESVDDVKTARRYEITGVLSADQRTRILDKLLMNKVNEHVLQPKEKIFIETHDVEFNLVHVPILGANDATLMRISKERDLFLTLEEMQVIREHFKGLDREPTDIELEMLAQTWSEHCSHKTLTGLVEYEGKVIDNLLKQTIFRVTSELNKPWCVSVFKDNAGIIEFDDDYNICFKVETHNHPSAMEPYGGANTGIGGVIRDPLGTGLGAKPVINTDVFCFGPVDMAHEDLPRGVLHPKRVMQGVVAGVRDYGNRMGIPTSNGSIFFDERYLGNPLVFCGNVGIMPKDKCEKEIVSGDAIIVVGGRTGRDGIHGATASSGELHSDSEGVWSGAVQIGNPIVEKKLVDTLMAARDRGLYRAITDCGAGGLSSAIGELAETTGAVVDLEKVPLKYHGLTYMEIWISEAQERMVIFVPPDNVQEALNLFSSEDVEATVIGHTTNDKKITLRYKDTQVGELDMDFLHNGMPQIRRQAIFTPLVFEEQKPENEVHFGEALHDILAAPNVCSKEWVIRQYDHEVQGGSVLKPLVGVENDGPGDACVTRPRLDSHRGVILSNGLNPKYGLIDPYHMAASAIDEAIRNVIAVGGRLDRTALLDNFCWGNTNKPDRLGGLVRAAQACYDIAKAYETPFISGKDSLNNEFQTIEGSVIAVPPTLLISAISIIEDVRKSVSMDLKASDNVLFMVGTTFNEMGGSHYYESIGARGGQVPLVRVEQARQLYQDLHEAMDRGLIKSCHDCSEGGIAVALAEMAFAGGLGATIRLENIPRDAKVTQDDVILFSESNSRFIIEVAPEHVENVRTLLSSDPIGKVLAEPELCIIGLDGSEILREEIHALKQSWQKTLGW
ncbi:phosphoribosylformylglycinamidine synthase subunit PurL [candidate division KSB1 bacterium]|nr:phosphoribosylformylglycinamidine synthase subunit PurL [candidate division KSB1 bacterium]